MLGRGIALSEANMASDPLLGVIRNSSPLDFFLAFSRIYRFFLPRSLPPSLSPFLLAPRVSQSRLRGVGSVQQESERATL